MVSGNDARHDGKTQTTAPLVAATGWVSAKETFSGSFDHALGHAAPVVGDRQYYVEAVVAHSDSRCCFFVGMHDCIADEIDQCLSH